MKVRCNQCMNVFEEEEIVYDGEMDMEFVLNVEKEVV